MDAPSSASRLKGGGLRQYYVAVSSADNKLATLLDLLRAFEAAAPLSLVACCGARDSLDALVAAAAGVPHCRVWVLHADLSEREAEATVRDYRAATQQQAAAAAGQEQQEQQQEQPGGGGAGDAQWQQEQQPRRRRGAAELSPGEEKRRAAAAKPFVAVLAVTDAALRALSKELLPLSPTLLVSYDLPARKDAYLRRTQSVLGSRASAGGQQRIAVHFAVAGLLEELRQVEEFSERPVEEMPVHVSDILAS